MNAFPDKSRPPRWLFWWAVLTVVAVCPLLFMGALVTTMGVGMADQRSLVLPHQAVQEFVQGQQSVGWKIEHIHRLTGWFAGMCGIVLAIGFRMAEPRSGVRWAGLVGLVLIGCQGLLGIFRVALHSWWGPGLAWIHGSFAQLVFAVLVGIALLESSGWLTQPALAAGSGPLRKWSLACAGLVFVQLIVGGMMRHQPDLPMARLHVIGAFLVFGGLLWLVKLTLAEPGVFRWSPRILLGLLGIQVVLGVEALLSWLARYFNPALGIGEPTYLLLVRSAHYLFGSFLFAATVVIALKAQRGWYGVRNQVEGPQKKQEPGVRNQEPGIGTDSRFLAPGSYLKGVA